MIRSMKLFTERDINLFLVKTSKEDRIDMD